MTKFLSKEEEADKFYDNVDLYHKKVDKIQKLIRDYFDHTGVPYEKEYAAIKIIKNEVSKSTHELNKDIIERVEYWLRNDFKKEEIENNIYSIEFKDSIFFFKVFDFNEDELGRYNLVLAGYLLRDSALVRTFLAKLTEDKIREKYERILSII